MPDKIAQKIKGLAFGISCDDAYVSFYFSGPDAAVREAVRDAYCGLRILDNIGGELRFLSEEQKMEGRRLMAPSRSHTCIKLPVSEFDRLVLMYRYCTDIGFHIPVIVPAPWMSMRHAFESTDADGVPIQKTAILSDYLAEVARVAARPDVPLAIPEHARPDCSLLWTAEERAEDTAHIEQSRQARETEIWVRMPPGLLQSSPEWIEAHSRYLVLKVEQLVRRHPGALQGIEGKAWNLLDYWAQLTQEGREPWRFLRGNLQLFPGLRRDDIETFELLANGFVELRRRAHMETTPPPPPGASAFCAIF